MATYKAGQEIDSYCTKCKMDLLHKIIAVVSGKPAKVECRTCYGVHLYREPKSARAASSASASTPARSSAGAAPRSGATRRAPAAPEPPLMPPDHTRIALYKMTDRYAAEAWIQHKSFGVGQVQREVGPNKIEVRFESGPRVLVHGVTQE